MSGGFGKLFASMYDGTLYGRWQALVTFQQLIILCDADGVVDMTPHAIAARTSIPLEIITQGIGELESPDPYSRTPDFDGRRLERLDEHRPWGWRIVNYLKYRDSRDLEAKRRADRERVAAKRAQAKNGDSRQSVALHQDVSPATKATNGLSPPMSPHAEAEADTEADTDSDTHVRVSEATGDIATKTGDFAQIKATYPKFTGKADWINAQHFCHLLIDRGSTWNVLTEGVKRYAAFCEGGGVSSERYVMTPGKFFSDPNEPWAQAWELPKTVPKRSRFDQLMEERQRERSEAK